MLSSPYCGQTAAAEREILFIAASFPCLDRRALDCAVGAEHAAVTRLWPQQFTAAFAVVVKLTGVGRHAFPLLMSTLRTGDNRNFYKLWHRASLQPVLPIDRPAS